MKNLLLATCLILVSTLWGAAQCTRHVEKTGGFSYCAPDAWTPKDPRSGTYKTFMAPQGDPSRANLNWKDEVTSASHAEYLVSALKFLLAKNDPAQQVMITEWEDFTTDARMKGTRMAYVVNYKGMTLRVVQYIFDRPGKKLLLTGTALDSYKTETDKLFDATARSIRTP